MLKFISFFISALLILPSADANSEIFKINKPVQNANEYFAGSYPGAMMMKVHVLGGVHSPGVYNVPVNSELSSVLSYAGGPTKDAEFDKVFVKRKKGDEFAVKKINMKKFFENPEESPYRLAPEDHVYISQRQQLISDNTFRGILVISTVIATILSAITIDRSLKR